VLTHIHPSQRRFPCRTRPSLHGTGIPAQSPGPAKAARCPEPLGPLQVFPPTAWRLVPRQRALPLLHRSYDLMRQTTSLPLTSVVPPTAGLCRLSSVPAARWPFPAFSPRICLRLLGPLPPVRPLVHLPVSSQQTSAFTASGSARHRTTIRTATSVRGRTSGRSIMRSWSGLRMCSPPRSLLPQGDHWAAVASTSEPLTVCSLPAHRICAPSASGN
jgi:hypothetical protein